MESRRKILAAIGTGTGIALAGCVGDDAESDDADETEEPSAQECANAIEILSVDDGEEPHPISFTLQNTLDVEARYTMTVEFMGHGLRNVDTVTKRESIGGGLNEVVTFSPDRTTTEYVPDGQGGTEEAQRLRDVFYWDGPEDYGNTHTPGDGSFESDCA